MKFVINIFSYTLSLFFSLRLRFSFVMSDKTYEKLSQIVLFSSCLSIAEIDVNDHR